MNDMVSQMLDYVVEKLPTRRADLLPIHIDTGVPVGTMEKIARGYTKNPRIKTLQTLHDYFKQEVV